VKASIVIPTWKRRSSLERTLAAACAQDFPGFEIVVVSDGPDPDVAELAEGWQKATPVVWKFHPQNRGLPAARNTGVAASSGCFILFLDDDVVPAGDWLSHHLAAHERAGARTIVVGSLEERYDTEDASPLEKALRARRQHGFDRFLERCARNSWSFDFAPHCGNNSSIARAAFDELGGFDELQRGIHEDLELGERARAAGMRFVCEPRAHAVHHNPRPASSYYVERPPLESLSDLYRSRTKRQLTRATSRLASLDHGGVRTRVKERIAWSYPGLAAGIGDALVRAGVASGSSRLLDTGTSLSGSVLYWKALRDAGETRASLAAVGGPATPALVIHGVSSVPVGEERRYHMSASRFDAAMRSIRDWGFGTVLPEEFRVGAVRPSSVMLTFDDGYEDLYTHAFPLLQELGMTATIFVVVSRIGGINEWDASSGFRRRRMLSRDQIREMHRHGISFGSHSLTHPRLTSLGDEALTREVSESKHVLEDLLGESINSFAYPSGNVDDRVRNAVGAAGYSTAFTTMDGLNHWNDPLLLQRAALSESDSVPALYLKLRKGRGPGSHVVRAAHSAARGALAIIPGSAGARLRNVLRSVDASFRRRRWEARERELRDAAKSGDESP
jgi:peptidoglycan/xylan/chitin deacetylase (PgdA/CDA1 family)/glycosyltransferase involved in cell wall biosynthesis